MTETGKQLAKDRESCLGAQCKHASDAIIAAIEAEAVAAERERIRAAVEELADWAGIDREAVLRIVERRGV